MKPNHRRSLKPTKLKFQLSLPAGNPLCLQFFCAGLVLPKYLHECARAYAERLCRSLRVSVLGRNDVEHVRHEQWEQCVACLYVPVAPGEGYFCRGWCFPHVQG